MIRHWLEVIERFGERDANGRLVGESAYKADVLRRIVGGLEKIRSDRRFSPEEAQAIKNDLRECLQEMESWT